MRNTLLATVAQAGVRATEQSNPGPAQNKNPVKTAPLWLAVQLPHLCLEALISAGRDERFGVPCIVVAETGGQQRVLAANPSAGDLGVRPGMPVNAAHARGRLSVLVRDERAEHRHLHGLALWAMQFTPVVSRVPPDGLLLEIRGSLALFGGATALLQRLHRDLSARRHEADLAVAPTPVAATVLARARYKSPVFGSDQLRKAFAHVAVAHLRLAPESERALAQLGVRTVSECLRLPRADLARRLGVDFVRLLDRLTGIREDPRARVMPPKKFDDAIDIPWAAPDKSSLMACAAVLLNALGDYLRRCCGATSLLHWRFVHADRTVSELVQELRVPRQDPNGIAALLEEQLERLPLPAPVTRIGLRVERFIAWQARSVDLFSATTGEQRFTPGREAVLIEELLDRLCAKLGADAAGSLACHPDHRPERAWRWLRGGVGAGGALVHPGPLPVGVVPRRPLWLLPRPRPLARERFVLCSPRERIESGWWDGHRISRDYHVAKSSCGDRLWVFQDLREPQHWYLHGYFV